MSQALIDSPLVDQQKAEAFCGELIAGLNHAGLMLMISVGHRTGLFDCLAQLPPSTSDEIAGASALSERYVREWLGAMVTGKVVDYDAGTGRYSLPAEHAMWLTRTATPNNVAVTAQWISVLGSVEDEVVRAFAHGKGVAYSAYRRFHPVMAEESGQTVIARLVDTIVPLVPGLRERLATGIDALDVGCGAGRAVLRLAEAFPKSRFTGYDLSAEAVAAAEIESRQRRLSNARFEVRDVTTLRDQGAFDLVTAFDAIHDQAQPAAVLAGIRRVLKPDGTFLMQDIGASSHVHENVGHQFGPFLYTISTMHCMSVSLANGGVGLGTMWGRETALRMLGEAGFADVRLEHLEHDPINDYYVAR